MKIRINELELHGSRQCVMNEEITKLRILRDDIFRIMAVNEKRRGWRGLKRWEKNLIKMAKAAKKVEGDYED